VLIAWFQKYVALLRRDSSQLSGHCPIEHDSPKTDGVLGTKTVHWKTYGNLGQTRWRPPSFGGLLAF
jgi:hypothetical protein